MNIKQMNISVILTLLLMSFSVAYAQSAPIIYHAPISVGVTNQPISISEYLR